MPGPGATRWAKRRLGEATATRWVDLVRRPITVRLSDIKATPTIMALDWEPKPPAVYMAWRRVIGRLAAARAMWLSDTTRKFRRAGAIRHRSGPGQRRATAGSIFAQTP